MRKLKTGDIPAFGRCLKNLGAREMIKQAAMKADNLQDIWDNGFDIVWELFDKATETEGENALYEFLAGPFEMTAEEVKNLDLDILMTNLNTLATENDLLTFFKSAAKSMKKNS